MHPEDMQHAVRVVAVQGAILGMLRAQAEEDPNCDGLTITAQRQPDGSVTIDLTHTMGGMSMAGEGL